MRIRQLIIRFGTLAGIVTASVGLLLAWQSDDPFVGTVCLVFGIGLMAASLIYSLAMDDSDSRAKALATKRHPSADAGPAVDVRDAVNGPTSPKQTAPSTRVGV